MVVTTSVVTAALVPSANAQQPVPAQDTPRAVIELFTSQGCSSCPPADRLLGEIANDKSVLALSVPVDYWDYLGWKDTLAVPGNTSRQRAYAKARGDREVFTPQVVVNGSAFALGSDRAAIDGAIEKTAKMLSVPVRIAVTGDKINVNVATANRPAAVESGKTTGRAQVWLCPISKRVPVAIGRGENSGKYVVYTNVVRRWVKLGEWSGAASSFSVPLTDITGDGIDAVAVVVQDDEKSAPGPVLGASLASLP